MRSVWQNDGRAALKVIYYANCTSQSLHLSHDKHMCGYMQMTERAAFQAFEFYFSPYN